jgi:hypothetical protein
VNTIELESNKENNANEDNMGLCSSLLKYLNVNISQTPTNYNNSQTMQLDSQNENQSNLNGGGGGEEYIPTLTERLMMRYSKPSTQ